ELLPLLLRYLKDDDVDIRRRAASALRHFRRDGETTASLRESLKDADSEVRRRALLTICESETSEQELIEFLMIALEDADPEVRLEALRRLPPKPKTAVPGLVKMLQDKNKRIRNCAIRLLESIGPEAKAATPDLAKLLDDADANIRIKAANALGNF